MHNKSRKDKITELRKQILDLINIRMRKYVNLPLNERQSAFYELADLEKEIVKLFDKK